MIMGFLLLEDPQILSDEMSHIHIPCSYTLRISTFYVKLFKRALFSISKLDHIRFLINLMYLLLFS